MSKNDYIFISYSRYDAKFVDRLSLDLRDNGVQVWIDTENIAPGTLWQEEIEKGLNGANALIFVISRHSIKSKWMFHELVAYTAKNKKIIPLIIEDVDSKELPAYISNIQWLDFKRDYDAPFATLLQTIGVPAGVKPQTAQSKKKQSKGYAFLSYAEEDSDFTKYLKKFLKQNGYAYWDYEESDRDYHSQLYLELEGIISEASTTLSILSESWKRSPWTVKEFFFSEEVGTPVFLLKAKKMGPTLAIAGMSYIDFTQNIEKGLTKLHKELSRKGL